MIRARLLPPKGSFLVTIVEAGFESRLLGHADKGHLGMAVDGPGHLGVVDRDDRLAEDALYDHDRLRRSRHGPAGVSRRRRRRRTRPSTPVRIALVHVHESTGVDLDTGALGQQPVGAGAAADRHQDHLDLELLPIGEDDRGVPSPSGSCPVDADAGAKRRSRAF